MAVDAGDMYVAEQNDAAAGRIRKYPAAGGNPVIIADNLVSPRSIAVRGGIVYWSDVGDASISRAPTSGAGPTTQMAISQPSTYKVAVDDTSIYWLSAGDGAVRKLDLGAVVPSTPTMLSTTSQNVTDMVIDGTSAYWLDENGNNAFSTIYKVSLQGGQKMMIASQEFTYSGKLALDGSYLYWDAVPFSRVPIAGGKVEHIPQAAPPYASSIAIDATKAYWTGMDGTVNALGKL
jgi:hypothetical protein